MKAYDSANRCLRSIPKKIQQAMLNDADGLRLMNDRALEDLLAGRPSDGLLPHFTKVLRQ